MIPLDPITFEKRNLQAKLDEIEYEVTDGASQVKDRKRKLSRTEKEKYASMDFYNPMSADYKCYNE